MNSTRVLQLITLGTARLRLWMLVVIVGRSTPRYPLWSPSFSGFAVRWTPEGEQPYRLVRHVERNSFLAAEGRLALLPSKEHQLRKVVFSERELQEIEVVCKVRTYWVSSSLTLARAFSYRITGWHWIIFLVRRCFERARLRRSYAAGRAYSDRYQLMALLAEIARLDRLEQRPLDVVLAGGGFTRGEIVAKLTGIPAPGFKEIHACWKQLEPALHSLESSGEVKIEETENECVVLILPRLYATLAKHYVQERRHRDTVWFLRLQAALTFFLALGAMAAVVADWENISASWDLLTTGSISQSPS